MTLTGRLIAILPWQGLDINIVISLSLIINGTKMYITNGPICDFVLLAASTDGSEGGPVE
jgi:hypothetical protein